MALRSTSTVVRADTCSTQHTVCYASACCGVTIHFSIALLFVIDSIATVIRHIEYICLINIYIRCIYWSNDYHNYRCKVRML